MSKLKAPGDRLTPIDATTAETASTSKRGIVAAVEDAAAAAPKDAVAVAAVAGAEEGMYEDWPINGGEFPTPDPLVGLDK